MVFHNELAARRSLFEDTVRLARLCAHAHIPLYGDMHGKHISSNTFAFLSSPQLSKPRFERATTNRQLNILTRDFSAAATSFWFTTSLGAQ